MTLEDLADLIRANSANTNGRIDGMRAEVNATLMTIQNDFTDVRGDIGALKDDVGALKSDMGEVRRTLDLAGTFAEMRRQIEILATEVAELKRRAS